MAFISYFDSPRTDHGIPTTPSNQSCCAHDDLTLDKASDISPVSKEMSKTSPLVVENESIEVSLEDSRR